MIDAPLMPETQSLSDLLRAAGLHYRVFDLGRRVTVIEQGRFSEMEAGNRPYAYPLLRQAWMGIVFWEPSDKTHNAVWFVKWLLDEQGLPIPAARDDFLRRVLDRRSRDDGAKGLLSDVLEANPYAFRPAEERMAVFHAKAGRMMGGSPSVHYDFVRAYLRAPSRGDWTTLGYQGIADVVARDDFLRRVLDRRSQDDGAKGLLSDVLEANPYAFRPAEERMAVFHAKAGRMMGGSPSVHYDFVRAYLRAPSRGDWTTLGYQGIADVAARLDADGNVELLAAAIPGMPAQPLTAFCQGLENVRVPLPVAEALAERAGKAASADEAAACVRGLSYTQATALRDGAIETLLSRDMGGEKEVLSAISNRAWESLRHDRLAGLFLNRLAGCEPALFNAVMADLLYLPGMREPLLTAMRNPDRPPHVAAAIGGLFEAYA